MIKIGMIDYFLDEWHADNYPKWIHDASGGEVEVLYAWGEIDSPRLGGLTNQEWTAKNNIRLCSSMDEVIELSDGICVLAPDNPETHERLCARPLMSGKPTFIDKTFAPDRASAERIFNVADRYSTPCYTSSALRFADEYQGIDAGQINFLSSTGGGNHVNYLIHQIEPLVLILGTSPVRVKAAGRKGNPTFFIDYPNDVSAMVTCFAPGVPFQMSFNYLNGTSETRQVSSDFFDTFIRQLIRFYKTSEIIVPHEQTIAVMTLREACLNSLEQFDSWLYIQN